MIQNCLTNEAPFVSTYCDAIFAAGSIKDLFILSVSINRLPCRIKCFPEFSLILGHGARCNRDKWYFFVLDE